ncbi:MAG: anti-sigma factor antagonist [Anaerolineae bacterium]|nr:anti-sigma factor antagonist [Anaerolineae bacterium]
MADVRRLVVSGRYENIPLIIDLVREAAADAGFDEPTVYHCQMSVDEACTNIVEHAYGGEDRGDIEVTCTVAENVFSVTLLDQGQPFDPESIPVPVIDSDIHRIRPGGIGLHLMRQLMDEVHFSFSGEGNRLTMVKRARDEGSAPPPGGVGRETTIKIREVEDGAVVISPDGRLDSTAAPEFENTMLDSLHQGKYRLVIDMSSVTYISSRGLKALVTAWRIARENGGDIVLCSMKLAVFDIFQMVGFTKVFTIVETIPEALSVLRR